MRSVNLPVINPGACFSRNIRRFTYDSILRFSSVCCFMLTLSNAASAEANDRAFYESSILHLTVTRAVPDPESPWALQNLDVTGHAGVVIGENRVLTQASLISRAVYIQAQKVDDVEKIPMVVVFADYEANLAILAPAEGHKLGNVKIMRVGQDVPVGSDVTMIAIENERQLLRVSLRTTEVGLRESVIGGISLPVYSLGGQARTACRSDPIIRKGLLIGMCVGTTESQPQSIAASVINHFLNDKLTQAAYRGFISLGVSFVPIRSPWHRKMLGIKPGKGALRVAGVFDTSPYIACLKEDDVLTAVDAVSVDHRGFYQNPMWGAVPLRHYLATKYAGDSLSIHYIRDGKGQSCTRKLVRFSSQDTLVPGQTNAGGVPHLIFGGLVFRELSVDYLSVFGRDWRQSSPQTLSFVYTYLNLPSLKRDRKLVLSNVLGDEFNAGYQKLGNSILEAVNGQSVTSIDALSARLRLPGVQRGGVEYAQFDFLDGTQIVLPQKGVAQAHKRIAATYAVTNPNSFFNR
jgi:PDZ domain